MSDYTDRASKTFGFASDEFQVTADRLGVYLPVVRQILFYDMRCRY